MGITANVGMNRKFAGWETSADFAYSQNVFTIGSIATTSTYNYGASVRKKLSPELSWNGSFRGTHSGLQMLDGNSNHSENFSSGVVWRKYNFTGNYSQSQGVAVINSNGELTSTPGAPLLTDDFLLFNARGFSVGGGTRLFRAMTVSSGFSRFTSNSLFKTDNNWSVGYRYSGRVVYQVRKFYLEGAFSQSNQDVSTIPGGPHVINSFYVSLSRWFNVF
jgi:hypothetical protein